MNASVSIHSTFNLRAEAQQAPTSGIVDVFSYGRSKPGIIPLWVGEGDLATPSFIGDAAARSLQDGETFYRELAWLCLHQHGAFNSPVWFNVGLYHQYGVKGAQGNSAII